MAPTDSVERTLDAAAIPPERRGGARTAPLNEDERSLYHWILRRFAGGRPPSPATLLEEAELRGLPLDEALATLAREDLMHLDPSGAVAVAYPFSGRPTAHRVRLDGHDLYAMCAIDALGIGPMLRTLVAIDSRDPLTGEVIHVEVNPTAKLHGSRRGRRRCRQLLRRGRLRGLLRSAQLLRDPCERTALARRAQQRPRTRRLDPGSKRRRARDFRRCPRRAAMTTGIGRKQLQRLRDEEEAQLVEVLPATEYQDEHLPSAINIPLKELGARALHELDPARPVIVYCHDYT